ncbi:MAG: ATP-dependent DNA helicase RecG [Candidatus Doudnabacteria bacterium]|nr:ATP-dependent DNA helicase RecG [Candidatus Doudnabacteria bacterium]
MRQANQLNIIDPVSKLPGVGEKNAQRMKRLGIFTVDDLVHYFPFRYDDLSQITNIRDLKTGGRYTISATITQKKLRGTRNPRFKILEALAHDNTGSIFLVWFNQPYLDEIFKIGATYLFSGTTTFYKTLQMQNPIWEETRPDPTHTGRIVPVYQLTAGIYPKWFRTLIKKVLSALPDLADPLPEEVRSGEKLIRHNDAIRTVHFPQSQPKLEQARYRLAFDELLFYQLKILLHKKQLKEATGIPIPFNREIAKKFVSALPFTLTDSQKIAAWEIIKDLSRAQPANRLLAGDVGSGKTVVAALATLQTLCAGRNAVFMAPTEILAKQHFETFTGLPEIKRFPIVLLTSSNTLLFEKNAVALVKKPQLLKMLPQINPFVLIGTSALIQKNTALPSFGLTIIDEQHRFGVQQRAKLAVRRLTRNETRLVPHFLSLTATPIPRTLALTLYGDLDVSQITQMPTGRKPVATAVVAEPEQARAFGEIEKQIKQGRQAFVVCPIIDPSDALGVNSATAEYERLKSEIFKTRRLGLLHGRLAPREKQKTITQFKNQELDILVATPIVEVGMDFPNATVMLIEGAERFGLAQLHQLRGRVGRSHHPSFCYLLAVNHSGKSRKRLEALTQHHNGLELAEIDLKLRGPGELYGRLQSGYPQFKIADVFDTDLLLKTHQHARAILEKYDQNSLPQLFAKIPYLHSETHPE